MHWRDQRLCGFRSGPNCGSQRSLAKSTPSFQWLRNCDLRIAVRCCALTLLRNEYLFALLFSIERSNVQLSNIDQRYFVIRTQPIQLAGCSALALWDLGLALMPIDSAAPAYQLSDLKPADRLAVLRRTPFAFLDLELCGFCVNLFDLTRPTPIPERTEHLAVSSTIGALLTDAV